MSAEVPAAALEWRTLSPALEARVGARAWAVWRDLLELRDAAGDVRATAAGIGKRLVPRLSRAQVQEQLDRLRRLGLVAGGGWRYAELPAGTSRALVEVYERRVVGALLDNQVGLPTTVWQQLDQPRRWGGARPGSGPRRPIQDRSGLAEGVGDSDCPPSLSDLETTKTVENQPIAKCSESLPNSSRSLTELRDIEKRLVDLVVLSFPSEKKKPAQARSFFDFEQNTPPAASAAEVVADGAASAAPEATEARVEAPVGVEVAPAGDRLPDGLPVARDSIGGVALLGRGQVAVTVPAEEWGQLPPYPGVGVLSPAVVPPPPLVTEAQSEDDRVALLLQAYGLVCQRQLPREFNPHSRHPLKATERRLLVAAAEALRQHSVSPLRWVEFSFAQWAHGAETDRERASKRARAARPPLRVVFALARIESSAGWCRSERERRGSRVLLTRSLRLLQQRWQTMTGLVLRGELSPSAARARLFGADGYERLLERARDEARRETARVTSSLASGDYLW